MHGQLCSNQSCCLWDFLPSRHSESGNDGTNIMHVLEDDGKAEVLVLSRIREANSTSGSDAFQCKGLGMASMTGSSAGQQDNTLTVKPG